MTTRPPTAHSAPAALLAASLAGALALAAVPAAAQPREPAAPRGTTSPAATGTTWWWPLDATGGAPAVLRPATLPARPWQRGHRGVDLAAAPGEAVLAPVDGVVVVAGRVAGRGVVSIRSASGWRATLEPVDPSVAVGDVVARGRVVGALSAPDAGGAQHCGAVSCLH